MLICSVTTSYAADQCFGKVRLITRGLCQETDFNLQFEAMDLKYREVYIKWNVVDNPDEVCRKLNKTGFKQNGTILACAIGNDRNVCNIYTSKNLNLAILGHEVRHCFEKDWHE